MRGWWKSKETQHALKPSPRPDSKDCALCRMISSFRLNRTSLACCQRPQLQTVSRAPPPSAGRAGPGHNNNASVQPTGQRQQHWGAGQSQAQQRQHGTAAGAGNASARSSNNGYQQNREQQQHADNFKQGGRQPQLEKQQQHHHQQRQTFQAKGLPVSGDGLVGAVEGGQGGHQQNSASPSLPRDNRSSGGVGTANVGRGAPPAGEDRRSNAAPPQPRHQRYPQQQQGGAGPQSRSGPSMRSQNQGQQHRPEAPGSARAYPQESTSRPGASRAEPAVNLRLGQQQQQQQQQRTASRSQTQQQHQGQVPPQPQRHPHSNGNVAAPAAATAPAAPPAGPGRGTPPPSALNGQAAGAGSDVPPDSASGRQQGPRDRQGNNGDKTVVPSPAAGSDAAAPAAATVGGAAVAQEPQPPVVSPPAATAALADGSSSSAAAGAAPEGEAAVLRARLAEAEAKNAEALARVRELEENNFDLEAAMQVCALEQYRGTGRYQGLRNGYRGFVSGRSQTLMRSYSIPHGTFPRESSETANFVTQTAKLTFPPAYRSTSP